MYDTGTRGTILREIKRLNFESLKFRHLIFRRIVPLIVIDMSISINFIWVLQYHAYLTRTLYMCLYKKTVFIFNNLTCDLIQLRYIAYFIHL